MVTSKKKLLAYDRFILEFFFNSSMSNLTRSNFQAHPFHLVSPSPWPLYTSISLLTLTTSGVQTMHGFYNSENFLALAFISLIASMSFWFRDIIAEGRAQKKRDFFLFSRVILFNYILKTARAMTQKEIEIALINFNKEKLTLLNHTKKINNSVIT